MGDHNTPLTGEHFAEDPKLQGHSNAELLVVLLSKFQPPFIKQSLFKFDDIKKTII